MGVVPSELFDAHNKTALVNASPIETACLGRRLDLMEILEIWADATPMLTAGRRLVETLLIGLSVTLISALCR